MSQKYSNSISKKVKVLGDLLSGKFRKNNQLNVKILTILKMISSDLSKAFGDRNLDDKFVNTFQILYSRISLPQIQDIISILVLFLACATIIEIKNEKIGVVTLELTKSLEKLKNTAGKVQDIQVEDETENPIILNDPLQKTQEKPNGLQQDELSAHSKDLELQRLSMTQLRIMNYRETLKCNIPFIFQKKSVGSCIYSKIAPSLSIILKELFVKVPNVRSVKGDQDPLPKYTFSEYPGLGQ
jgi:hypothetical protein